MKPEIIPLALKDFHFDAPLMFIEGVAYRFSDETCWHAPAVWVQALAALPSRPQVVVIPLELASPAWNRQDLFGYELLNTLRWIGDEGVRGCPVLVAAWQSLADILQKRPDLLFVRPSIEFMRLPEAIDRVPGFFEDVQQGRLQPASNEQIEEASAGVQHLAERVSYHDLANDYYAAYRLWRGYRALLKQGADAGNENSRRELDLVAGLHFEWEQYVASKLSSPLIRRYLATRRTVRAPRYPIVENSVEILTYHLGQGLPEGTRVLFVDDEFHKGFAHVLLRMLFRTDSFTRQLEDEWVYSEPSADDSNGRWARLVCVRNAELAEHWLAHWEQLESDRGQNEQPRREWLDRWVRDLSPNASGRSPSSLEAEDVFGANREFVLDRRSDGPRIKSTVVLLDLRLEPVQTALYSIKDFPSYRLRELIKTQKPDMPVIMFTASRQVLNFAELLDSSGDIDGWFIKEAPDVPVDADDSNSANSVAYLLERVHLYSTLRGWYRPSFAWNAERKLEYAKLFHSKEAAVMFKEITRLSDAIFIEIRARGSGGKVNDTETFLTFIQARVPNTPFAIAQTLVARRVALAALLWTADMTPAGPNWNADAFAALLPGRSMKKTLKWVYDKINFNQVLWMRSSGILSQLLREEIEWLTQIEWPESKREMIQAALLRERQFMTL